MVLGVLIMSGLRCHKPLLLKIWDGPRFISLWPDSQNEYGKFYLIYGNR